MTLYGFITKNAMRNRRRTMLSIMSIALSLALIVILRSVLAEIVDPSGLNESVPRLVVRHRTSLTMAMPDNYRQKIEAVPGVKAVVPMNWFGGNYKDEGDASSFFPRFAVDPQTFFDVYVDYKPIDPAHLVAWQAERASCLMGEKLMKSLNLKIGDRITIEGDIYPLTLELTIRGAFTGPDPTWVIFHRKYLDELMGESVRSGTFFVLAESPEVVPRLLSTFEAMFRNSDAEVKAETEKAFQLSFVEMLGNVKTLFGALIGVIVFAIVLIAASTMAMAIRERTRELAVLKTIGFDRELLLALVVFEGLFVSFVGGLLGVGGVYLLLPQPRWFIAAAAGIVVFVLVGLALLVLAVLLPDSGTAEKAGGLGPRLQRVLTNFGPFGAIIVGGLTFAWTFNALGPIDWFSFSNGFIPYMGVRADDIIFGTAITFLVGLASSAVPAWNASRVKVIEGLRDIG